MKKKGVLIMNKQDQQKQLLSYRDKLAQKANHTRKIKESERALEEIRNIKELKADKKYNDKNIKKFGRMQKIATEEFFSSIIVPALKRSIQQTIGFNLDYHFFMVSIDLRSDYDDLNEKEATALRVLLERKLLDSEYFKEICENNNISLRGNLNTRMTLLFRAPKYVQAGSKKLQKITRNFSK